MYELTGGQEETAQPARRIDACSLLRWWPNNYEVHHLHRRRQMNLDYPTKVSKYILLL